MPRRRPPARRCKSRPCSGRQQADSGKPREHHFLGKTLGSRRTRYDLVRGPGQRQLAQHTVGTRRVGLAQLCARSCVGFRVPNPSQPTTTRRARSTPGPGLYKVETCGSGPGMLGSGRNVSGRRSSRAHVIGNCRASRTGPRPRSRCRSSGRNNRKGVTAGVKERQEPLDNGRVAFGCDIVKGDRAAEEA